MNKRVVITSSGGPEKLLVIEEPLPEPRPTEVRIRVEAAGLGWGDVMMRRGIFFGGKLKFPLTPGYDAVGRIDAIGPNVNSVFLVGERVAALTIQGGYSEYICVPSDWLVRVPEGLDETEAAAIVLNYTTALQMLTRVAHVKRGQSILVHGAAGGVGSALLDLGRHLGLETFGTASTQKLDQVRAFGATAIDYKRDDLFEIMRRLKPLGVDVVFDARAGSALWTSLSLAARTGRVITYGISGALKNGKKNLTAVAQLLIFLGVTRLRPGARTSLYAIDQVIKKDRKSINEDMAKLFNLLSDGRIRPLVAARLPLSEAQSAHERLESHDLTGKLVFLIKSLASVT